MRNGQFSLAELQLSSPLPSPNRQLSGNNNNRHTNLPQQHATHNNTATESAISLEPLYFDSPQHHSDLYPLASMPTPESIRKFTFTVDGHPSLFVETNVK
jgi:hypothetical protein